MRFSSRVDRVLAWWAAGIICAVVLALGALALINRIVYNPAGQVSQYFQAVRDGNGARALGILGADVPDSNAAMLNGDALKNSMKNLKDLETQKSDISADGTTATVTVAYTLDGQAHTTDFHLTKVASHWGVFDQWQIDPGTLPTVHVSSENVTAATLNNAKVAVDHGSRDFAVTYPGEFTATYESALYTSQEQSVEVTDPHQKTNDLKISLKPSDSAQKSISSQIQSQLNECATQNTLYPAGCPFEYPFDGRVQGDVKWEIKKYPQPEVTLEKDGSWALSPAKGTARISFAQLDLYTGKTSQVNNPVNFTYTGTLSTSDTEVTVKPTTN